MGQGLYPPSPEEKVVGFSGAVEDSDSNKFFDCKYQVSKFCPCGSLVKGVPEGKAAALPDRPALSIR